MVERKTLNLVVVGSSPTEGVFATRHAALAQLGERQTEDLKVPGSIPGRGIFLFSNFLFEFLFAITIHVFKWFPYLLFTVEFL